MIDAIISPPSAASPPVVPRWEKRRVFRALHDPASATRQLADARRPVVRGRHPVPPASTHAAVLAAFQSALDQDQPMVECYLAAVRAWEVAHPEHSHQYAAAGAVDIILGHRARDLAGGLAALK